jgi:phosphatidylglycerol:prolipoprotein diacylglycerol transferase
MWVDTHHKKFHGQIICLYGILYSVERFFVEGLRTDSLMLGPLRQAQVISIVIIAGCCLAYYILQRKNRRTE